jgi:DNA-binding NarL/FixJ family response regulator
MNPSMQGAHLISEIKKNFPQKYVLAYTGGAQGAILERSIQIADDYLKKDVDIDDWCDHLDNAIEILANPAKIWRQVRHRLLDAGISPYQLAVLEDTFVRNALCGRNVSGAEGRAAIEFLGLASRSGCDSK